MYFDSSIFNFTNEHRDAIFQSRFSQKLERTKKFRSIFFQFIPKKKKKIPSCLFSHVIHNSAFPYNAFFHNHDEITRIEFEQGLKRQGKSSRGSDDDEIKTRFRRNSSAKTWYGISRVYNMYSSCRLRTFKRWANRQVFEKDSSTNTDMQVCAGDLVYS